MEALLSSTGMLATFAIVLTIQALSLLLLAVNVRIFKNQSLKYWRLVASLGKESAWGSPGRILLPLYVLLIFAVTIVSTMIFLWQPHLL